MSGASWRGRLVFSGGGVEIVVIMLRRSGGGCTGGSILRSVGGGYGGSCEGDEGRLRWRVRGRQDSWGFLQGMAEGAMPVVCCDLVHDGGVIGFCVGFDGGQVHKF